MQLVKHLKMLLLFNPSWKHHFCDIWGASVSTYKEWCSGDFWYKSTVEGVETAVCEWLRMQEPHYSRNGMFKLVSNRGICLFMPGGNVEILVLVYSGLGGTNFQWALIQYWYYRTSACCTKPYLTSFLSTVWHCCFQNLYLYLTNNSRWICWLLKLNWPMLVVRPSSTHSSIAFHMST